MISGWLFFSFEIYVFEITSILKVRYHYLAVPNKKEFKKANSFALVFPLRDRGKAKGDV
jgi:hypothetical protein